MCIKAKNSDARNGSALLVFFFRGERPPEKLVGHR